MPAYIRIAFNALLTLALLYVATWLLPYLLGLLPERVYDATPLDPYILNLLLPGLIAGTGLALITASHRLVTTSLVALGLAGIYAVSFYAFLCNADETLRIHTEMAAMPTYNLALPHLEQPTPESLPTVLHYACVLPEERTDNLMRAVGEYFLRLLAILAGLLFLALPRKAKQHQ